MGEIIGKTIKLLAGLALIVFDAALLVSLFLELRRVAWLRGEPLIFLSGAGFFLILHLGFKNRPFLYVFTHEVSHAIASVLTGSKVHSIYVSNSGGTTKTEKSNLFILLFPYIFPFLAVLTFLSYRALDWAGNVKPIRPYFYFAIGLFLAHHLFFTVYFILKGQSDIRKAGTLPGLGLVGLANIILFAVFADFLFSKVSLAHFWEDGIWFFRQLIL